MNEGLCLQAFFLIISDTFPFRLTNACPCGYNLLMSKLVCKDFSVRYFGYDAAINNVTTTFSDGINVVFAGEKGGKTTFLKALAGVIPHSGELFLDDVNIDDVPLKDRDFQMLFDDYALFSRRSVRYNLEYPLKIRKMAKEERRALIESVAPLFDLDIMIDAPVYRLNEWLKVALVLCRAYMRRAKVLLIDNVFSKLSVAERREAFLRFIPLFRDAIVIYATDDKWEAAALSREIKHLTCGYLMQEGSQADFVTKARALSVFTAWSEYPSILPCTVRENGMEFFGVSFENEIKGKVSAYIGKNVIAGVLPQDISMDETGFEAEIIGRFYHNDRILYCAERDNARLYFYADEDLSDTSTVKLSIAHVSGVFDALNERNIMEVI